MPLRSVVHCPFNQAQTIEFVKRGRFKSKCNSKLSPSLRPRCLRNKLLWMKQQLWIKSSSSKSEGQLSVLSVVQVYIKLLFFLFPVLRAFSRFLSNLLGGSLPFIFPFKASEPSSCKPKGLSQYTYLIGTLLKVAKRVASCGVTVQGSFPH